MSIETISKRDELIRFIDKCFDLVHECSPHNLQRKKEFAIKEIIKLLEEDNNLNNMTLETAVKKLCEAPSCLSKSKARKVLEEYGNKKLIEGYDSANKMPMGASEWLNHGIKYKYLEYFKLK